MREDQIRVTVSVDGVGYGVWETFDGGEGDSDETKNRPGALEDEESLGGPKTRGNVTVSRNYKRNRDQGVLKVLDAKRGRAPMTVVKQPLDPDKNAVGQPDIYTGTLKRVTGPNANSNSGDPAKIELEMTAAGAVG